MNDIYIVNVFSIHTFINEFLILVAGLEIKYEILHGYLQILHLVGIFILFSNKFNPALKVFLLSLAVVDDLISIAFIAIVYSLNINFTYLIISFIILSTLIIANNIFKVESITYYLISGVYLWYFFI